LFAASEQVLAAEAMDPNPPVVSPGIDQERAAWHAVQSGEATLAVVDEGGAFLGFIPPSKMLKVLLWEHDEDMARLGGFVRDAEATRTASEEPVLRRYWHRLPWLLLGLVGAFVAAGLMGAFEQELEANVLLAFFIPGIVYMADAVGTQTETLIIRGLSVGVTVRQVVNDPHRCLVGVTVAMAFCRWRCGGGAAGSSLDRTGTAAAAAPPPSSHGLLPPQPARRIRHGRLTATVIRSGRSPSRHIQRDHRVAVRLEPAHLSSSQLSTSRRREDGFTWTVVRNITSSSPWTCIVRAESAAAPRCLSSSPGQLDDRSGVVHPDPMAGRRALCYRI
jgi:hypothetical protein